MLFFTSKRERRLWLWALATIFAIYATLGLARTLTDLLRNRGLLDASFGFGMLLIIAATVMLGLKTRLRGLEVGVAIGIFATYLLVFIRMAIPEERTHLIEYGVVAVLIYEALKERDENGRKVLAPAVLAWGLTALLGWLDEGIQAVLPNRFYDIRDVGFNVLAALLAITASATLTWARNRSWG